jgi:tRNA threonylcarbamoyladenosine biosynthesis protein TsaE
MNYIFKDENDTKRFGELLYQSIKKNNILDLTIFFSGDLGTGKTTCVRAFIQEWGYLDHIKSPTFSLVEPYEAMHGKIYHFDFYRLQSINELEIMGVRDYFEHEAIRLVEWPEKTQDILDKPDIHISFDYEGDGRSGIIESFSKQGKQILSDICW